MESQQSTSERSESYVRMVGNVFVQQFFVVQHYSPDQLHRFYKEGSKIGRPGATGEMSTISSLQDINDNILSIDNSEYRTQIKTVDAQNSLNGGILVLVTGSLLGKDNVRRDFTQSFLLATQETGFYVLNDIFRYVEEADQMMHENGVTFPAQNGAITPQEHHGQSEAESAEDELIEDEVYDPSEHGGGSSDNAAEHAKEEINEVPTALQPTLADSSPATAQEKNASYASIVIMSMKKNHAPVTIAKSAPNKKVLTDTKRQAPVAPTPAPALARAAKLHVRGSHAAETNVVREPGAVGYSIYIRNLPSNATCAQLEEAFKNFGPIKPNGIQVRSNKLHGVCFGFVEFEVANAVKSAIKASPVLIGGRKAYVEEKRTNGSRAAVNNMARFAPGPGRGAGYRGTGMMGRGYYVGGRGYGPYGGEGDYSYRADFGNRGGRPGGGHFWRRRSYVIQKG